MTEVTPPYYASGRLALNFDLVGGGFLPISGDVLAVTARNNNDPLEYAGRAVDGAIVIEAQVLSNTHIKVEGVIHEYNSPRYIGALVSVDRSVVYWVNNTAPLP